MLRQLGPLKSVWTLWNKVAEDNVFVWASALAYSWLLAIFPFVLCLIALLPYMPEAQKHHVMTGLSDLLHRLPAETAAMLDQYVTQTVVRTLSETRGGLLSAGLLVALWAASGGMSQTMLALDKCYDVAKPDRPFYIHRPLAIVLTLVTATLMLLVLILLPIGGVIIAWAWNHFHLPDRLAILVNVARWSLGVLLMMAALNVVYYFGTRVRQRYRFITPGAAFCIMVWIVMGLGFRFYVDRYAVQGYNKTYGAVGGVAILLVIMYLCAVCLLVGAEINSIIDRQMLKTAPGESDLEEPLPEKKSDQG